MTETADAEVSLRNFVFQSVLNEGWLEPFTNLSNPLTWPSDPTTKSVNILGSIGDEQAIIVADKTAFEVSTLSTFVSKSSIPWVTLLDKNDIYHWFLGGYGGSQATSSSSLPQLKLTLIYPATETHIRKYSRQSLRMVTETAETYKIHVEPFIKEKWGPNTGRINWVYNILEHKKESERIVFENPDPVEGFILLPDLKWDRKTMSALYLMAVTHRRDITSIRDLTKKHIPWLEKIRAQILAGTTGAYPEIEKDQLKLFIHCESCACRPLSTEMLIITRPPIILSLPHSRRSSNFGRRT